MQPPRLLKLEEIKNSEKNLPKQTASHFFANAPERKPPTITIEDILDPHREKSPKSPESPLTKATKEWAAVDTKWKEEREKKQSPKKG